MHTQQKEKHLHTCVSMHLIPDITWLSTENSHSSLKLVLHHVMNLGVMLGTETSALGGIVCKRKGSLSRWPSGHGLRVPTSNDLVIRLTLKWVCVIMMHEQKRLDLHNACFDYANFIENSFFFPWKVPENAN
jgi:hypothetical protein